MRDKSKLLAVLVLLLVALLGLLLFVSSKHIKPERVEPTPASRYETASAQTKEPDPTQVIACDSTPLHSPSNKNLTSAIQSIAADRGVMIEAAWLREDGSVERIGGQETLPAWSTAKVPLALAATDAGLGGQLSAQISLALRESDNEAADAVWNNLGTTDAERANAVTQVFRTAGDDTTVPSYRIRAGFSVFGQTEWDVHNQVNFLKKMPCLTGSGQVIEDMSNVSPGQRWGLGTLPDAVFKGGWGPDQYGYVVRQLGWYTGAEGRVPIAFAVRAADFGQGQSVLNQIAADLEAS